MGQEVLLDESCKLMQGAQVRFLPCPLTILFLLYDNASSPATRESRRADITTQPGGGTKPGDPTRTPNCRCKMQRGLIKGWEWQRATEDPAGRVLLASHQRYSPDVARFAEAREGVRYAKEYIDTLILTGVPPTSPTIGRHQRRQVDSSDARRCWFESSHQSKAKSEPKRTKFNSKQEML